MSAQLSEAEDRLAKVEESITGLREQSSACVGESLAAEKAMEAELYELSDVAAAASIPDGRALLLLLKEEEARQREASAQLQLHAAKVARVDEARKQAKALEEQLAADEAAICKLTAREADIEASMAEAAAQIAKVAFSYEAPIASARELVAAHRAFLDGEQDHDTDNAKLVKERHDAWAGEAQGLESAKAVYTLCLMDSEAARRGELRSVAKEKQAIIQARDERKRFFAEKVKQLNFDEQAVDQAAPFEGQESCLEMLSGEILQVQTALQGLREASSRAEASRKAKASELNAMRTHSRSRLDGLRLRQESEESIARQRRDYVAQLQTRRAEAALRITADSGSAHARALVEAENEAMQSRLALLTRDHEEAKMAQDSAMREREATEARAARTLAQLRDVLSSTREAILQLSNYERGLAELLEGSAKSDAAVEGSAKCEAVVKGSATSEAVADDAANCEAVAIEVDEAPTGTTVPSFIKAPTELSAKFVKEDCAAQGSVGMKEEADDALQLKHSRLSRARHQVAQPPSLTVAENSVAARKQSIVEGGEMSPRSVGRSGSEQGYGV